MSVKEAEAPKTATKNDIEYLERRIERINEDIRTLTKKLRVMVGILVDKKIIGEAAGKAIFGESLEVDSEAFIEWLKEKEK